MINPISVLNSISFQGLKNIGVQKTKRIAELGDKVLKPTRSVKPVSSQTVQPIDVLDDKFSYVRFATQEDVISPDILEKHDYRRFAEVRD